MAAPEPGIRLMRRTDPNLRGGNEANERTPDEPIRTQRKNGFIAFDGPATEEPLAALALVQPRAVAPQQADSDAELLRLWLHGRPTTTRKAYERDSARFLAFVGVPIRQIRLADLQQFADSLHGAPATRARKLAVVRSLLTFASKLGYVPFNVGAAIKLPPIQNVRAERILSESDVHRMFALEPSPRNRTILRTLYGAGIRVSELCGLRSRNLQARDDAGQVTVLGKGHKTRAVLLPASLWADLQSLLSEDTEPGTPVFLSRKGGPLSVTQVWRTVRTAAKRIGLSVDVSPHWLRHAHASHALDRGAPIHLVQATLGHGSVATTGAYLHARPGDSSSRYLSI